MEEILFFEAARIRQNQPVADNYLAISGDRKGPNANGVLITMCP